MSFEEVSNQLSILKEANVQLKDLIDRLANINFQPGSVPLGDDDENVATELTSEIQQTIKDQDEDFELLLEEVRDLDAERDNSELAHEKEELLSDVTRAISDLKSYQSAFRKAQITAKRKLEAAQRAERDLLLQSYIEPPRPSNSSPTPGPLPSRKRQQNANLTEEEKTVNAASDVTRALRRTHDMMAAELARSQFAHETLTESTAALAQLSETYSTLDTLLSNSRNLLGTLLRSQKSDTWYLETAFYILLVTIGWLVWRRFLYGPIWWLLWFPIKMFFKGWMGVFTAMGLLGGGSSEAALSSGMSSVVGQQQSVVHISGTRDSKPSLGPPGGQRVIVGGGGKGAPMQGERVQTSQESAPGSMSEQVGKIIDESQEQPISEHDDVEEHGKRDADIRRNPKKRMWEEEKEQAKEDARKKDEL